MRFLDFKISTVAVCSALLLASCGGGVDEDGDFPSNPSNPPANQPRDPTPPSGTPVGTPPVAPPLKDRANADRGSSSYTETENISVYANAQAGPLSFGLLESSGGNYELEPIE